MNRARLRKPTAPGGEHAQVGQTANETASVPRGVSFGVAYVPAKRQPLEKLITVTERANSCNVVERAGTRWCDEQDVTPTPFQILERVETIEEDTTVDTRSSGRTF